MGRKHFEFLWTTLSEAEDIYGVPQGPLLFLLFINDLFLSIDNVLTNMYADDTTPLYSVDTSLAVLNSSCIKFQNGVRKIECW